MQNLLLNISEIQNLLSEYPTTNERQLLSSRRWCSLSHFPAQARKIKKTYPEKGFYIFSKERFSYILRNGISQAQTTKKFLNFHKKIFFLYFVKWNFLVIWLKSFLYFISPTSKPHSEKNSYILGNGAF